MTASMTSRRTLVYKHIQYRMQTAHSCYLSYITKEPIVLRKQVEQVLICSSCSVSRMFIKLVGGMEDVKGIIPYLRGVSVFKLLEGYHNGMEFDFFTYDNLKQKLLKVLQKDDCKKLVDYFCLPKDQADSISKSNAPTNALFLALEERDIIYPSNISRLIEAFVALQMSETYYEVANFYQENARVTSYDKFLVTLSAHLTASLPGDLCDYFNISDKKKTSITSSQNPGLSLLLALNEMGVISQSMVAALEQPFSEFRLVQAVAKVQEYQSVVEDEKDLYQQTMGLTKEGKRNLLVKLLQKKIKSWYETMTPVPWKKSCQWKSSDLFIGSGLILTNSKTQGSVSNIDEQCKLQYTEIFSHNSLKNETRLIIEGEPGSGKTMLSSQLAYDWSQGEMTDVNIFILLPLKLVQMKTLVEATRDFYLPEGKGLSVSDIEEVISGEGKGCCFLLDGLEEYNTKGETSSGGVSEVMKVMTKVKYPNCKVIITSRSDYAKNLPPCPMLKLGKFGKMQRHYYIAKVFSDNYEKQMEVKKVIDDTPFILDLCTVPLLFVLAVHNVEGMANVRDIGQDRVAPFVGKMIETLYPPVEKENEVRGNESSFQMSSEQERRTKGVFRYSQMNEYQGISLEMLAFNGLCRGRQQLSWQKKFIEENVRNVKQYLDSGILIVEETVKVGKSVERIAQENTGLEGEDSTVSDASKETSFAWSIPSERDTDNSRPNAAEKGTFKEAIQEFPKYKVATIPNEGQSSFVKETIEPPVKVESHPTEDFKSTLSPQHVSLQVKFLHKVIQEWFAARHLAGIFWNCDELSLLEKYKFLRNHLEQINPVDLHYVLRFTCALCPPSCHFILNYLHSAFKSKTGEIPGHIVNCITLCIAEYDGYKGHYIKDVISEVCKADITIHSEDSRLLQGAKVSMLQFASKCKIPISRLQLRDVVVRATEDELTFNSGATLKILNTLQKIEISRWDHTLKEGKEGDYANVIKFVLNSASIKETLLAFPSQPLLPPPKTLKEITSKQVTVRWDIGELVQTLDPLEGMWKLHLREHLSEVTEASSVKENQDSKASEEEIQDPSNTPLSRTSIDSIKHPVIKGTEKSFEVVQEETALGEVVQSQQEDHSLLETKAIITRAGGMLEIPNTGVSLFIPPNALPEHMDEHEMHMRIISWEIIKEKIVSFSSNSTTVVELLPDSLVFQLPVRLSLPHCVVLKETEERKARIFLSHHKEGSLPNWTEHTHLSYSLEDTACTILLDRFCWVKYVINDEIVMARKIVVYTAAKKIMPQDEVAETVAGYYPDLPEARKDLKDDPNMIITHKKAFYFVKRKENYPLRITLDKDLLNGWHLRSWCSYVQKIFYEQIASRFGCSFSYVFEKPKSVAGYPLCVYTVSQENGPIDIQLAVRLQVMDETGVPGRILEQQSESSLKVEGTITNTGGKLEIPDTGVVLDVPAGAIEDTTDSCKIYMRIIPRRKLENQVPSFCISSSTAVEIFPSDLKLKQPAKLSLPHCLVFDENKDRTARIFMDQEKGSPSLWKEQTNTSYELKDDVCIIQLDKLCCVKYSVNDDIVTAKIIRVYTAAKKIDKKDDFAEVEVGYYPDIPEGGELLRWNPNLHVDSKRKLLFMDGRKLPLQLILRDIAPTLWERCFPKGNSQKIPFTVIASSIEHSHLYILERKKKSKKKKSKVICMFTASQEGLMETTISFTVHPQEPKHVSSQPDVSRSRSGSYSQPGMKSADESMSLTILKLSRKLTGEWEFLGRELGLKDEDLYRIKVDASNTHDAIYNMLECWRRTKGNAATYENLIQSLKKVRRTDLAEKVQNLKDFFEEA